MDILKDHAPDRGGVQIGVTDRDPALLDRPLLKDLDARIRAGLEAGIEIPHMEPDVMESLAPFMEEFRMNALALRNLDQFKLNRILSLTSRDLILLRREYCHLLRPTCVHIRLEGNLPLTISLSTA